MRDDLDSVLRRHYSEKQLSARQLSGIQDNAPGAVASRFRVLMSWFSIAALVMLMLVPTLAFVFPDQQDRRLVSADITKNHLAGKPADFFATDFEGLSSQLSSAGLSMQFPTLLIADTKIVGARLCALAGEPAIHIFFEGDEQERRSLFIAKAEGALQNVASSMNETEATAIITWAENGHFYALAKDSL